MILQVGCFPPKKKSLTKRDVLCKPREADCILHVARDFLTTASKVELTRVVLRSHLSHEKEKTPYFPLKSWLFHSDPYFMVEINPHCPLGVVSHPRKKTLKQPGYFGSCLMYWFATVKVKIGMPICKNIS